MLAGVKEVKDTERSKRTAIRPMVPFPVSTSPSHDIWNNPSFEDFCSAKEIYFVLQKPRLFLCWGLDLLKAGKETSERSTTFQVTSTD